MANVTSTANARHNPAPTTAEYLRRDRRLAAHIEALEGDSRNTRVLADANYEESRTLHEQEGEAKGRHARTIANAIEMHQTPDAVRVAEDLAFIAKVGRSRARNAVEGAQRTEASTAAIAHLNGAMAVVTRLAAAAGREGDQEGDRVIRAGVAPEVKVTLPKGNLPDIITIAQSDVVRLKKDKVVISAAPEHQADREAALIAVLDKTAEGAPFRISRLTSKPEIGWPVEGVDAESTRDGGVPHCTSAAALAAWAFREDLVQEIKDQLDDQYEGITLTLNLGQKLIQQDDIDDAIVEAERIEAAATWAMRAQGLDVPFRAGIDPHAILGVAGRVVPRRNL